jgi:hypothetical protein
VRTRCKIEFSAEAERGFTWIFDQLFESYHGFGTRLEAALDHCEKRIRDIRAVGAMPESLTGQ